MEAPHTISIREPDGSIVTFEPHRLLPSTSRLAKEYAANGYPDRYVVFAEKQLRARQTASRGDDVETVSGMFMSMILRPSFFPSQASLLGAMSSVALIRALEEHTDRPLGLGWVTDLYCGGVRIGNVTIEGKLDSFTAYEHLIISFSVIMDSENFPPRMTDMIKQVFDSENTSISMIMARNVLDKFFRYYPTIKSSKKFMDTYVSKFALRGVTVKCELDGKKRSCKIIDVDRQSGSLIVDAGELGIQRITSPSLISIPKKIRLRKQ
ncbi:MAG: hypothetical protein IJX38_01385 [Clostridia bacterium]|nr:hypothetical protein [Clostridia bacterium]